MNITLQKTLTVLWVFQEKKNLKSTGRGFTTLIRLNPYNPLTYIFILLAIIVATVMFGVVGVWQEVDYRNPFKWQ